jgi:hypothetical protein
MRKINLTLEQAAYLSCTLVNFAVGMLLVIILNPKIFNSNVIAYYFVVSLSLLEFALVLKINFDAYRYGLVEGYKRNFRRKEKTQMRGNTV